MVMTFVYSEKGLKEFFKKKFSIFILWMLKEKPDTGYNLIKRIEKENVKLTYSQLYPLLNSLHKKGYLKKTLQKKGKRKSYIYSITKKGEDCFIEIKKMMTPTGKKFCKFLLGE